MLNLLMLIIQQQLDSNLTKHIVASICEQPTCLQKNQTN